MIHYDAVALERDPNLQSLVIEPGPHAAAAARPEGVQIAQLLTSRAAFHAIMGAVIAAPNRPPITAVEALLLHHVGPVAFEDELKRYSGRIIRQIVEHVGGKWVRSGEAVKVPSRYRKASIYEYRA